VEKTHRDTAGTGTASSVTEFSRADELPEDLLTAGRKDRFELDREVGKGGVGRVYALRDHSLGRTIAVKFLQKPGTRGAGVRRQFIREARVTAALEHPNIMPVYDVGVTEKGEIFFTMKKVGGVTLGDAIRQCREGRDGPEEFRTIDGRVRIFLKVCDALTYAHHQGFIHQDVKPDNIMLGEFGEVLVLDWGSARSREDPPAAGQAPVGTPAYMSPEQARREIADERSDIYCLGATLFQALLLRHPTWSENAEVFWERKRTGALDLPTAGERRRVPAALLDIALKALEPDPGRRYQSVAALADDLKRWQAGRAVGAHRETVFEAFGRWYRRNQRVFWIAVVSVLALSGVGGLLFREKIQEMLTWRRFFTDDFSSYGRPADLARNWRGCASESWLETRPEPFGDSACWRVERGSLQGYAIRNGFSDITFSRRIPGDIRVEWTATAVLRNLDLNCYIAGDSRLSGYTFHVGGFGLPGSDSASRATPSCAPRCST